MSEDYKAPRTLVFPEVEDLGAVVQELRSRLEELEGKYETMRLATLEWGEDVDKVKRWSDQHLQRIMALEANENCRQQDEDAERAAEPAPAKSLVDRVANAIYFNSHDNGDEARAAIREVAAWMRENDTGYNAVRWLEMEVDNSTNQEGYE